MITIRRGWHIIKQSGYSWAIGPYGSLIARTVCDRSNARLIKYYQIWWLHTLKSSLPGVHRRLGKARAVPDASLRGEVIIHIFCFYLSDCSRQYGQNCFWTSSLSALLHLVEGRNPDKWIWKVLWTRSTKYTTFAMDPAEDYRPHWYIRMIGVKNAVRWVKLDWRDDE